jgi:hypothetical protein
MKIRRKRKGREKIIMKGKGKMDYTSLRRRRRRRRRRQNVNVYCRYVCIVVMCVYCSFTKWKQK